MTEENKIQLMLLSLEQSIDHLYEGIEKVFLRVESIESQLKALTGEKS